MHNSIKRYLPDFYKNILEFEKLIEIEDSLLNNLEKSKNKTIDNLYLSTCDIETIKKYESLFNISDSRDDLEFRRERILNRLNMSMPFTLQGLKFKLDEIIGKNNYDIKIDYDNFIIYIESQIINQNWFTETYVTVNKMKPANMIFINKPVVNESIKINESLSFSRVEYNYKLGKWKLGQKKFKTNFNEEVAKMPESKSISNSLLSDLKNCTLDNIAYVKINGTLKLTNFLKKEIINGNIIIEYLIPKNNQIISINKVELFNSKNELKSSINLYIPFLDDLVLKHNIKIEEGV